MFTQKRSRVIKIENHAAGFSQALPNGFRDEVIKNMAMRRIVLTVRWKSDMNRAKLNYSTRYRLCLRITTCQRVKRFCYTSS